MTIPYKIIAAVLTYDFQGTYFYFTHEYVQELRCNKNVSIYWTSLEDQLRHRFDREAVIKIYWFYGMQFFHQLKDIIQLYFSDVPWKDMNLQVNSNRNKLQVKH